MALRKRRGNLSAQRSQPGTIIAVARRQEGGAMRFDMEANIDVEEFAALMEAMSELGKALGFPPGDISAAHARIMQHKQGMQIANRNTDGTDGTSGRG